LPFALFEAIPDQPPAIHFAAPHCLPKIVPDRTGQQCYWKWLVVFRRQDAVYRVCLSSDRHQEDIRVDLPSVREKADMLGASWILFP
jgi:hypothetical protein